MSRTERCALLQKNDYEKARREQIRKNLERMQELNVVGAAARVAPVPREKPPRARGLPARRCVRVRSRQQWAAGSLSPLKHA